MHDFEFDYFQQRPNPRLASDAVFLAGVDSHWSIKGVLALENAPGPTFITRSRNGAEATFDTSALAVPEPTGFLMSWIGSFAVLVFGSIRKKQLLCFR